MRSLLIMRLRNSVLALVGLTGAAAPLTAQGSTAAFFGCNALEVCASVEITTVWDGTKTNVAVRMRNWSTALDINGRAVAITSSAIGSRGIVSGGDGVVPGWRRLEYRGRCRQRVPDGEYDASLGSRAELHYWP